MGFQINTTVNIQRRLRQAAELLGVQLPLNQGISVINKTGSTIAIDKAVVLSGLDSASGLPKIILANAGSAGHVQPFITVEAIADGQVSEVYMSVTSQNNLNTNSFTSVGDPVYLSTSSGGFTQTAPSASTQRVIPIGFVLVKSATIGQILWLTQLPIKYGSLDFQSAVIGGTIDGVTLDTGGSGSSTEVAPLVYARTSGTITAANITGPSAGQLGHANGVVLLAGQGATKIVQLISALIEMDFATAAYTGGGVTGIKLSGGGIAVSNTVAAAVFIQAAADISVVLEPPPSLTVPSVYVLNAGLNLVSASAPTNPGTAAGVIKWQLMYRILTTALD